jgi:hypothetical protein
MCRLFHRLALGHIHGLASRKTTETSQPGLREKKNEKFLRRRNPMADAALFAAERRLGLANARIR